jgi:hypothetical protein
VWAPKETTLEKLHFMKGQMFVIKYIKDKLPTEIAAALEYLAKETQNGNSSTSVD